MATTLIDNGQGDTYTVKKTGEEVRLLHLGFDIVIVAHKDGWQELLTPEEIGLKRRIRCNRNKRNLT